MGLRALDLLYKENKKIRRKNMKTGKDVIAYAKDKQCKVVDLKFVDLLGTSQHFTISMDLLDDDLFEEGNGFDGSSIRGWKAINESDMLILPDPSSARIDPFCADTTLSL